MKAKINGIDLGYEVLGQDGEPIVLIHGFGLDRTIWWPMVERHLGNAQVVLPDVRGHGESDAPEGPYNMTMMATDLAGLLDYLGIRQAIVCGHSMGGYIALAFAAQYPERLAGLGLITSRAGADTTEGRAGRFATIAQVREKGAVALVETLTPRLTTDEDIRQGSHAIIAKTDPSGIIGATYAMADRPDRTDLLPQIEVPALVVAGEADQIISLEESIKMAELLPRGELLVISNAGHMPMLEAPAILAKGLLSLAECASDSQ